MKNCKKKEEVPSFLRPERGQRQKAQEEQEDTRRGRRTEPARLYPNPDGDTGMQANGLEAAVTRKRAAETDVRHLEERAAEIDVRHPEAERFEFDKRTALKRKGEGDPTDSETEDSVIESLAEWWRQEDDPDDEVDLLLLQQRDRYLASVQPDWH